MCCSAAGSQCLVPHAVQLSLEDSAQLDDLALDSDSVVEDALARRSNSGPLSRTLARVS